MKPATVSRLVAAASLAPPVVTACALAGLGLTAAVADLNDTIAAPLALTAVVVCAIGITGCAVWVAGVVRDRRRPPTDTRPM